MPFEYVLILFAAIVVTIVVLICLVKWHVFRRVRPLDTGVKRRALWPHDKDWPDARPCQPPDDDIVLARELLRLDNGTELFYCVVTPVRREISKVVFIMHGYGSNSNHMRATMKNLAIGYGCAVICPDLPSHGRSDGKFMYIPDWFAMCDHVWSLVDERVNFLVDAWSQECGRRLRLFLLGESMGGAVAATLAMQRPKAFDGLLLVAPMLYVSDSIKPSRLVVLIFQYLLLPLLPSWPVAPSRSLVDVLYREPRIGKEMHRHNALSFPAKPRLATAFQLAFRFPDWFAENVNLLTTPFFVLHGDADLVTDPTHSRRLHEEAPATTKRLKLYPGVWHAELLHPGVDEDYARAILREVLNDIDEWTNSLSASGNIDQQKLVECVVPVSIQDRVRQLAGVEGRALLAENASMRQTSAKETHDECNSTKQTCSGDTMLARFVPGQVGASEDEHHFAVDAAPDFPCSSKMPQSAECSQIDLEQGAQSGVVEQ